MDWNGSIPGALANSAAICYVPRPEVGKAAIHNSPLPDMYQTYRTEPRISALMEALRGRTPLRRTSHDVLSLHSFHKTYNFCEGSVVPWQVSPQGCFAEP